MHDRSNTHLVLLPVVFFLAIPALFLKQNIGDVSGLSISVMGILAGLTVLTLTVLLLANALFRSNHLNFILGDAAKFLCFFVIASGFVFPVSQSTGMEDPALIPINKGNLILALVTAAGLLWIAKGKYAHALYTGLILFVVLNFIVSVTVIASSWTRDQDPGDLYAISTHQNIFVLSFDGISGSAASQILAEDQQIASEFDGFTVFSQVASSSPATATSTAASLYGNANYKSRFRTENELWNSAPENLLTNTLESNGFRVSTYGIYSRNFQETSRKYQPYVFIGVSQLLSFTIARTFTGAMVPTGSLLAGLDQFLLFKSRDFDPDEKSLLSKISQSQAKNWKKVLTPSLLELDQYIENLEPGDSSPVAHFLHFTFTHYPVEFDRDCNFMADEPEWFESRQNRFGVKEETYCALGKYSQFIAKLKELGVFDQSLIVLKSDHGKPVIYHERGTLEAESIRGHARWGLGRYAPFLAVKPAGSMNSALSVNDSPVMLDDLAKSICLEHLEISQCEKYPGFNLMERELVIPETAQVTLFIVGSNRSTFKYDTHEPITVNRHPGILQNLRDALSAE